MLEKIEFDFAFSNDQLTKALASGDRRWIKRATQALVQAEKRRAVAAVIVRPKKQASG